MHYLIFTESCDEPQGIINSLREQLNYKDSESKEFRQQQKTVRPLYNPESLIWTPGHGILPKITARTSGKNQ